tara:strand:+ start:1394 stop:2338 length:945 start_codon:yes stop_codon:yes gene_type:complete
MPADTCVIKDNVFHHSDSLMKGPFPSDQFCLASYRANNPDVASYSDKKLLEHYDQHGKHENRITTSISTREEFLSLLKGRTSLLEIGVFDSPSLDFLVDSEEQPVIHYADYLNKEDLIARAELLKSRGLCRNPCNVPEIKWVLSDGYEQIDATYDAVVSHHCIEHQPDLISHFTDIRSIIFPGGWYLFTVPNKYHCFDHFIPESTIVDVLESYYLKRKSPSFKSILEHRAFISHTYHDGVNPYDSADPSMNIRFQNAFNEFCKSEYVDAHCWQFSPDSFKKILHQLSGFKLIPTISQFRIYTGAFEFYVAIAFE